MSPHLQAGGTEGSSSVTVPCSDCNPKPLEGVEGEEAGCSSQTPSALFKKRIPLRIEWVELWGGTRKVKVASCPRRSVYGELWYMVRCGISPSKDPHPDTDRKVSPSLQPLLQQSAKVLALTQLA